jgi:hypothetical protein
VASNFVRFIFKQYQRFLKICNKWNQFYKFQIVFILISFFRFILLNPFCTPEPGLVTWIMLVGLLDFNKMCQIFLARHCTKCANLETEASSPFLISTNQPHPHSWSQQISLIPILDLNKSKPSLT